MINRAKEDKFNKIYEQFRSTDKLNKFVVVQKLNSENVEWGDVYHETDEKGLMLLCRGSSVDDFKNMRIFPWSQKKAATELAKSYLGKLKEAQTIDQNQPMHHVAYEVHEQTNVTPENVKNAKTYGEFRELFDKDQHVCDVVEEFMNADNNATYKRLKSWFLDMKFQQ